VAGAIFKRIVSVYDERCEIRVHHKTTTVWIARGSYRGKSIEVKKRSLQSAANAWVHAAINQSDYP
jgi:hypothetical protein